MNGKKQKKLLFVHGWATDKWVWKHQITAFNEDYELHTINLPGHGGPMKWREPTLAPPVQALLNLNSHEIADHHSYVGIGWSLGAQALLAASKGGIKIFNGLILIGATPCFTMRKNFPWAQPIGTVKKMIEDMKKKPKKTLKKFYRLNFTEEELNNENVMSFINRYNQLKPGFQFDDIAIGLEAILNTDLRDDLSLIDVPTLIVHGEKDRVCPLGAANYLANKIKKAELHILKKAGHAPFITEPKKFNQQLQKFIERL